jgi:hypothetical protein
MFIGVLKILVLKPSEFHSFHKNAIPTTSVLILSSNLPLRLTSDFFLQRFSTKILYKFIISSTLAECPSQLAACFCWFLVSLTFQPWWWSLYVFPKLRAVSELHGVKTQKTRNLHKQILTSRFYFVKCKVISASILFISWPLIFSNLNLLRNNTNKTDLGITIPTTVFRYRLWSSCH